MDLIYLDNNATTPLLGAAWEAMRPYFLDHTANPASSHRPGQLARRALEDAREQIAQLCGNLLGMQHRVPKFIGVHFDTSSALEGSQ